MQEFRFSIILTFIFLHANLSFAQQDQSEDVELAEKIENLTKNFKGEIGIFIQHLKTGKTVEIQADSVFPTASIVKIPIMIGVFDKIENKELHYRQTFTYRDSIKYGGSGLMQFFKDSTETDLSTLLALMLSYSDNTTSLWNQALAGGGVRINEIMDELDFPATRVNSRTPGREKIWEKYGWGQTTPREMAQILVKVYERELLSPEASEQMYRLLSNSYYLEYAISGIPPGVNVASKQGMVNGSRSEVFLVNAPEGSYVCSIFTKNNADESWGYENEAWVLARQISNLVYNYFNPSLPYHPTEKQNEYMTNYED